MEEILITWVITQDSQIIIMTKHHPKHHPNKLQFLEHLLLLHHMSKNNKIDSQICKPNMTNRLSIYPLKLTNIHNTNNKIKLDMKLWYKVLSRKSKVKN